MKIRISLIIWLNKLILFSVLLMAFLGQSCTNKNVDYYKSNYIKNKSTYNNVIGKVEDFIKNNDSIYKYMLEYTGKKLFRDVFINDSIITHIFDTINLSKQEEDLFYHIMYSQDIKYIIGYRDSIKYVYSGRHQDIIVHYLSGYKPTGGYLIDTNTYLFFEGTRSY